MGDVLSQEKECQHRECKEAGKKLCATGHEDCLWYGCDDTKHNMAHGPGGWIPGMDERGLSDSD